MIIFYLFLNVLLIVHDHINYLILINYVFKLYVFYISCTNYYLYIYEISFQSFNALNSVYSTKIHYVL